MKKNNKLWRIGLTLLFLACLQISLFAQTTKITGTVTEQDGAPLPGVNITVVGTTTGTITDLDGNYSVTAPADGKLQFTFIGFATQVVDINSQSAIDVALVEDAKSLQEVVVVGYGVQRKEAVTGSVASMDGDKMNEVASTDVTRALQGRIAGVEMSQNNSQPGSSMQIRIRGVRSLKASNDPLIVLDGIPFAGSISDISPGDIKSVDILKDASATAIYGSRGANGVILITSNKGNVGQKTKITYNGYYGIKKLFSKVPMMNGPEFAQLRIDAGRVNQDGSVVTASSESVDTDTDWQDLLYKPSAMVTSHDVGIAGGTENGSYKFGIGYYKDEALTPEFDFSRFTLRGSIDQKIGNHFRVGFSSTNNYSLKNGENRGMYQALSTTPLASPYDENGELARNITMPEDIVYNQTREILENLGDLWVRKEKGYGTYNSLYAEFQIPGVEGLKLRTNLGLNLRYATSGSYTGQGVFSTNEAEMSSAAITNSLRTNWVSENLITYDRTFAEKHSLNVVALYSAEETLYNRSRVSTRDIGSDAFQFYNLGATNEDKIMNEGDQWYEKSGLISYMGRVMYSYDDKYMISATYRNDASSRLAEGHKWHAYPAISLGWNISEESFMENVTFLNRLKLRAGYGQTSNQSVAPYKTLGRLSSSPYNFGEQGVYGMYVSELPNPSLGWEYSKTVNVGVDFALFNNRLSGTFEYYKTTTEDLLYDVSLPASSGVDRFTGNVGSSMNKGIELSLQGVILDNLNGWTWEAGLNLYANKNELIELYGEQDEDVANWWFVGHPINVIYDYKYEGLWQEGDEYIDILEPGAAPGDIKVEYTGEYNDAGEPVRQINDEDKRPIHMDPKFQGGFNTRVAYKGFDLSIIGAFKKGGLLVSTLYGSNGYLNMLSGRRNNVSVDYWTPENTGARYPRPGGLGGDNPQYGSTLGYFDASYVKIRTITLGYNLDNNPWLKNAGISQLRFYFSIQNPFVMFSPYTKESGMDPEPNSKSSENTAVRLGDSGSIDRILTVGTNTPVTRNYLFGMKLTF